MNLEALLLISFSFCMFEMFALTVNLGTQAIQGFFHFYPNMFVSIA